jgi:CheY-like chemotaxis protein
VIGGELIPLSCDAFEQLTILALLDLVLCDLVMPARDGLATLRGLRALAPTMPVIMMASGPADEGYLGKHRMKGLGIALAAALSQNPFTPPIW